MARRKIKVKRRKRQTMICKTLHRKLTIDGNKNKIQTG